MQPTSVAHGALEESVARFSVCQNVQLTPFGWKWQDQAASQSWRSYAQLCSAGVDPVCHSSQCDGMQILWAHLCTCPRPRTYRTLTSDCQAGSPNLLCIYLGWRYPMWTLSHTHFNATNAWMFEGIKQKSQTTSGGPYTTSASALILPSIWAIFQWCHRSLCVPSQMDYDDMATKLTSMTYMMITMIFW